VKSRSADRTLQRIAKGDLSSQPQAKGRADVDAAAADLGPAVERGQLALHYQPIVELRTGRCVRVEALIRWTHARFGLIDPRDLVRLAELTGLTQSVSTWAVREAARQRGVWLKAGLDLGITLNLVGPELRGSGPDELLAGIRTLFPSPNAFTFEVPSAVFARGEEWMRQGVSALSLAGARVSIDQVSPADAPTRSRSVDIDELKIARSVVLRAVADPAAAMTLRRLVQGARDLGLATVAVGVEDEATFRLANSLGCDLGQGFWMSRPVAAPDVAPFHGWLAKALLGGTTAAVAFAGMAKVALAAQAAPEVSHNSATAGATAPGGGDTCCSLKTDLGVRDVGLAMRDVRLDSATLHVESSVSESDTTRIADAVARDVAASEQWLGASFQKAPDVYVFATRNSFSFALQRGFGQRATDSAALATANGGVAFPGQNAIVVNWENVRGDTNVAIVRHELTHVLIHQLAGVNTELPAWFDEGVATLAERQVAPDAARDARDASAVMNLLRTGQTTLQELSASRDWTMRNATLDGRAYTFAAAGVSVLQESLGTGGLQKLLARAHDAGFATGFGEATGGSTSDFSLAFPARFGVHAGLQIAQTPAGDKVRWVVSGVPASASLKINIAGSGYQLNFEAIADRDGAYTAIFGGTAPAGDYTITVLGGGGSASAVVHIG